MPDDGNAADQIDGDMTSHMIDLLRVAAHMQGPIVDILDKLESELTDDIETAGGRAMTPFSRDRLAKLLKQTRDTISTAYQQIDMLQMQQLGDVARASAKALLNSINGVLRVEVATVAVTADQLRAIAGKAMIDGRYPKEWWARQDEQLADRFAVQMRLGMLKGEGIDQLVRRVKGTRASGYSDGIMDVQRRQAEALVRTSVMTVAGEARKEAIENNQDIIKGVTWRSTLDSRTTAHCVSYDGLSWSLPDYKPIDHDKEWDGGPPAHWNCRSCSVPVVKSWKELSKNPPDDLPDDADTLDEAIRQKYKDKGWSDEKIDSLLDATRASMDGQVPTAQGFDGWLNGKSEESQNDLLGVEKARLWRDGKVTLQELTDQSGNPLTIAELHAKLGITD